MPLAEGCPYHGPNVDHGSLRADRQPTAHCCRTGDKFDPQRAYIEYLATAILDMSASTRDAGNFGD